MPRFSTFTTGVLSLTCLVLLLRTYHPVVGDEVLVLSQQYFDNELAPPPFNSTHDPIDSQIDAVTPIEFDFADEEADDLIGPTHTEQVVVDPKATPSAFDFGTDEAAATTDGPVPTEDAKPLLEVYESNNTVEALDFEFCGRSPCRVLIPHRIVEQETKASSAFFVSLSLTHAVHIAGLAVLAASLDRDMVLPQARRSRYSLCDGLPFTAYHSIDSLRSELTLPASTRVHLWTEFQAYAYERARRGEGIVASSMTVNRENVTVGDGSDHCSKPIRREEPKFATFEHNAEDEAEAKAERIREVADSVQTDAMLVNWSEVERIFAPPELSLDFSPAAYEVADKLLESFGKTLALHWRSVYAARFADALRQEAVTTEDIPDFVTCAGDALAVIAQHPDIETVFLGSTTMHKMSDSYLEAARLGVDALRDGLLDARVGPRLTSLETENPDIMIDGQRKALLTYDSCVSLPDGNADADSGVVAMVAKIVAANADVFVAGEPDRCARRSSFTDQIVMHRRRSERQDISYFPHEPINAKRAY